MCTPLFQALAARGGGTATVNPARRGLLRGGGLFTGLLALQSLVPAAARSAPAPAVQGRGAAELIYTGGDIVTVNDRAPRAEAVAVRRGVIVGVGTRAQVERAWKGSATRTVDLAGRTLVPGFIDAHSHLAQMETTWGTPNLNPPPVGAIRSIEDIVAAMRRHVQEQDIAPGETVLASGYDDSMLAERRHPTRADLDRVSTAHPVLAVHASGHLLAANSRALAAVGYGRHTQDPPGGVVRRGADGEPDGVVEELAALPFMQLPKPRDMEARLRNLLQIQDHYAARGTTTAQDGISLLHDVALMREAAGRGLLKLDLVAYPRWDQFNDMLAGKSAPAADVAAPDGGYRGRFRIGGMKITCDGSPQGKTAYLSRPYLHPPHGQGADYRGYPGVPQEELDRWFDLAWRHGLQLLVHCNGDAAAQQMIDAARKAVARHGRKDLRPVMIHAQFIRHDQVDQLKALGIVPSFFTGHTFFWGDWHINETVGRERAFGMSPMAYALRQGLRCTNHTDAPIIPVDHLMAMWTAVNRVSRSGVVVGPDERVSALDALKAVTLHAAWQYHEERLKGSIEAGKLADLAVLDRNPLKVDPMAIKDIQVLQTIKEGRVIHDAA
ncbi:amidohydrolase [Azohydromonas aeria]|uniref:amidohydrolase n=1 Tax=Azohydromonas aeria TaxID=2590212 RepID=UPI0012FC1EA8|nr:amidohydrolase [Azohydromonas aeria]